MEDPFQKSQPDQTGQAHGLPGIKLGLRLLVVGSFIIGIITASVDEDLAGLDRAGFMAPDIPNVESIVQEPKTPEPTAQSAQVIDLASRQQTPAEEMAQQAREQIERLSA